MRNGLRGVKPRIERYNPDQQLPTIRIKKTKPPEQSKRIYWLKKNITAIAHQKIEFRVKRELESTDRG